MSEVRGAGGPPPSEPFFYIYRNYNEDDEEYFVTFLGQGTTFEQISAYGFTAPSGKNFKEYNAERDGSGTSYDIGDAIPAGAVYWIIWEDEVVIDYLTTNQELTSIANAIRTKGGTSEILIYPDDFIDAIEAIETGVDISDTTATAGDVLSGKYFYVANGTKTQGTIATKTSSNLTASGATVTAPAGYYATDATKTIASGSVTQNAPTINTSTGVVTATSTVTAGYVSADTKSNTLSLSTQGAKTVSPTESEQTAVASGKYTTGVVKVGAISSTYVGSDIPQNDSDDLTVSGATVTAPAGYYENDATKTLTSGSVTQNAPTVNTSTGVVTATSTVTAGYVSADTKSNTLNLSTQAGTTVSPTESEQTAVTAGKYTLGAVKVGAISSTYVGSGIDRNDSDDLTASGATVTAPAGYYATGATKTIANGSVTQNAPTINSSTGVVTATSTVTAGYVSASTPSNTLNLSTQSAQTITPTTANQTIASGKYLTGTQTILGDANLLASNIKEDVVIFGVTGTYSLPRANGVDF